MLVRYKNVSWAKNVRPVHTKWVLKCWLDIEMLAAYKIVSWSDINQVIKFDVHTTMLAGNLGHLRFA